MEVLNCAGTSGAVEGGININVYRTADLKKKKFPRLFHSVLAAEARSVLVASL